MCVRRFRARRRRHRPIEVLHKAACDKTFEEGRESGGKTYHFWVEKSGKTSWRWWHFVLFSVKDGRRRGRKLHSRSVWTFVYRQPLD